MINNKTFIIHADEKSKDQTLRDFLLQRIYEIYHCKIPNPPIKTSEQGIVKEFIEKLSYSNKGRYSLESGWKIVAIESENQLIVSKNELKLWVTPNQFIAQTKDIGTVGNVKFPKEFLELLPGFYLVAGQTPLNDSEPIVRCYWNITSKGATSLVELITKSFNEKNIPFQFKTLKDPAHYVRTDAAVLYLQKNHFQKSAKIILNVYDKIKPHLNPECSIFTKKMAPGLSLAEDPLDNDSFGQNRSRMLASALIIGGLKRNSFEKKKKLVYEKLHELGLNLESPYLCFSTDDNYRLTVKSEG